MRQVAQKRGQVAITKSRPSPTGGWNKRDNITEMPEGDAVILDNMFPLPSDVMLRLGMTAHATGFANPVNSLMTYNGASESKLFAASNTSIYDVSSSGAIGAAAVTGLTDSKFQHINFGTSAGTFLLAVNGADKMRYYTGSAWDVDGGGYTVTGVNTQNCIHITAHKRRVWLVEKASTKAWYLPADAIAGAAASFDLAGVFSLGGYLMAIGTWTLDAGAGVDDHCAFVSSEGEVAVYKGTDPSSATTWGLVGVWKMGKPIGRRCLEQMGGDLLLISKDGLLPFSKALMSSRVNTKSALTDKIQSAVSEATTSYGSNFGWEVQIFPEENMLLLNVPITTTTAHQYAMNTITGAWGRFKDWNALCWARFGDNIYFGGQENVFKAWYGNSDNGALIEAEALPAFSNFGSMSNKAFQMARLVLSYDNVPGTLIGLNVDYDTSAPSGTPSFEATTNALWDTATWDTAVWGGDLSISKSWQSVSGIGYVGSIHIKIRSSTTNLKWASTDFIFERGGPI